MWIAILLLLLFAFVACNVFYVVGRVQGFGEGYKASKPFIDTDVLSSIRKQLVKLSDTGEEVEAEIDYIDYLTE